MPTGESNRFDVRMHGFRRRTTVEEAVAWLDRQLSPLAGEVVDLSDAAGRVLAEDVTSGVDVPGFARAMMDGFALLSADTAGASSYNRLPLEVVGEALPGQPCEQAVAAGTCIRIMTGSPLPSGADAVLPVEQAEETEQWIDVLGEVTPGKHVGQIGEDIFRGELVLSAGRRLRPQDVGVLSSIGVGQVMVVRRPRVRIVVTGNELLPAGSKPRQNRIVDANSPMLAALICRDGGIPVEGEIVPDEPQRILAAMRDDAEIVLVAGGSSVGQEDHGPVLLAEHGQLAIHGIAMRPSSPTGLGRLEQRLVFLLPGNPVSCLCAYDFFAGRAVRVLAGGQKQWPYRSVDLPLRRKLVSAVGRTDYARVKIIGAGVEPLAIGGASVLSSTTRADGFVVVPPDSEGFAAQTSVKVYLY